MNEETNIGKVYVTLQGGNYSVQQIAERIGLDENSVRVYVNRLKARGLIEEVGKDGRVKLYCKKPRAGGLSDSQKTALKAFVALFSELSVEGKLKGKITDELLTDAEILEAMSK